MVPFQVFELFGRRLVFVEEIGYPAALVPVVHPRRVQLLGAELGKGLSLVVPDVATVTRIE